MTGTSSRQAGSWSRGCASRRARTRVRVTGEPAGWVDVVGAMSGASPAAVTPSLSASETASESPWIHGNVLQTGERPDSSKPFCTPSRRRPPRHRCRETPRNGLPGDSGCYPLPSAGALERIGRRRSRLSSIGGPSHIMAKRARGSTTTRPGQRRPLQRTTARPAATVVPAAPIAPRPSTLTDAEEARAAELEAAIVAEERRAEETKRRARPPGAEEGVPPSPSGPPVAGGHEDPH